ncbi:MAG TPA: hypothetical protein VL854_08340 [Nitrososphaeraceae archaeon]|jgi:hypothetical protein|nr:hypothetical protein [Nitrososphaeraceae archaeon]
MSDFEAIIANFAIGDNFTIERTVTIPSGTILSTVWFTVKRSYADSAALFQKVITTSGQLGVGIIDNANTAHFIFYLLPDDTIRMYPLSEYKYDIQLRLSDGTLSTYELGIMRGQPQVTIGS